MEAKDAFRWTVDGFKFSAANPQVLRLSSIVDAAKNEISGADVSVNLDGYFGKCCFCFHLVLLVVVKRRPK